MPIVPVTTENVGFISRNIYSCLHALSLTLKKDVSLQLNSHNKWHSKALSGPRLTISYRP